VSATFCMEKCESGPNVSINGKTVKYAQVEELYILIEEKLKEFRADILEFAE